MNKSKHLTLYFPCPWSSQRVAYLVCLYKCPLVRRRRCTEYAKHYQELCALQVPESYLVKYGNPELPEPYALSGRRRKV